MQRLLFYVFFVVLFVSAPCRADEPPVFSLDAGVNRIGVSVVNNYFMDLTNLTVETAAENLPGWLSMRGGDVAVDIPKGGRSEARLFFELDVADAPPDASCLLPLVVRDDNGNSWDFSITVKAQGTASLPVETALSENYPNPFNPTTTITYTLAESGPVGLVIFNSLGQRIRTLADGTQTAGAHVAQWDGRNELGEKVSSGVYFYRLTAGKFVRTKRMMLVE